MKKYEAFLGLNAKFAEDKRRIPDLGSRRGPSWRPV